VKRALRLLDELRNIIEGETRFEITEIARRHLKGPPLAGGAPAIQPPAQCIVDDLAEGPAGALRLRLELGRHVVIESQRRPHALMLPLRRHDVTRRQFGGIGRVTLGPHTPYARSGRLET
jgi:hypothetical protein